MIMVFGSLEAEEVDRRSSAKIMTSLLQEVEEEEVL